MLYCARKISRGATGCRTNSAKIYDESFSMRQYHVSLWSSFCGKIITWAKSYLSIRAGKNKLTVLFLSVPHRWIPNPPTPMPLCIPLSLPQFIHPSLFPTVPMEMRSSGDKVGSLSHRPPLHPQSQTYKSLHPKSPWTQRRIARARSDLNWERRMVDGQKAIVDLHPSDNGTAPVANRRLMSDTEPTYLSAESYLMDDVEASTVKESHMSVEGEHSTRPGDRELSLNQLFLLDPCHLSPLDSTHSDVTLKSIHDNLNAINIDDHTLEALLASIENSADESGHSFEHWRAAVRKMVSGARRLESPGTTQLAEAIMDDRAKALMETQMSLNDERIHLSKTKKALLDRSKAEATIAAEIEALEKETDSLSIQFFMKERSLEAKIQELKAAEQEQDYQEEKLEDLREALYEKEEIVSKVQATLDCERGRLKDILHRNITHLHHSNYA